MFSHNTSVTDDDDDRRTDRQTNDNHARSSTVTQVQSAKKR